MIQSGFYIYLEYPTFLQETDSGSSNDTCIFVIQMNNHYCWKILTTTGCTKLGCLLSHLQEKLESMYYPSKRLSLDESMIPFKGQLKFKQRMPLKPVKVGIKMFVVSEAQTGYCQKSSESFV